MSAKDRGKARGEALNENDTDVLFAVQDPGSADAARPKLQAAWQRWQELGQRLVAARNTPSN